jgi:hypothetical protein
MAINSYHCAATFVSSSMHQKLLNNQHRLSRQLDQSFQRLDVKTDEINAKLGNMDKKAERWERIVDELVGSRIQEPIAETLAGQNPRKALAPDLGTMAQYLGKIWRTGGATSDQDIWECYYDIVSVYMNHQVPVSARFGLSRPRVFDEGYSEREGLLRTHLSSGVLT